LLLKLYDKNPNPAQIRHIAEVLRNGGIIIFPTDTVYAFGCSIFNASGVEFIARIKNHDMRRNNLSFICHELSQVSEYAKMDDEAFKMMRLKQKLDG
jgi:tRNA threonylcarbamoyl adenosine modification protein (Sua5/YciO/YrdC/YwlC family)